jgi:hypothetical protein
MTKAAGEKPLLDLRRRYDASYAKLALNTRAAALNATCTRRGCFALHKDCTRAAMNVMATTSEKVQTAMLNTMKTKFGDIVPSIPGIRIFMVDDIVARPRRIAN